MILSSYNKFCNAIEQNEIKSAETIFASSDIRCKLISHSLENCTKDSVISVIESFVSRGLKEQALNICDTCSVQDCKFKSKLLTTKSIIHRTSYENKLLNNKNYFAKAEDDRVFDIHSGFYI